MISKEYALIVAGGKGVRMNSECPKPFLKLCGKPILIHTIEAFYAYSDKINIVLVLAEECLDRWNKLCLQYNINKAIKIQKGGATRFQSVKNGLSKIENGGLVAIHDGVRPLVSQHMIKTSFAEAAIHQTAIASVPLKDSIRAVSYGSTNALNRSAYRLVQTPQTFYTDLIKNAYERMEDNVRITDDASVAEQAGHTLHLFDGDYENIKITTPEDLIVAQALFMGRDKEESTHYPKND